MGFCAPVRFQPQLPLSRAGQQPAGRSTRARCPEKLGQGQRAAQTPTPHCCSPSRALARPRALLTSASLGCLCVPFLGKETWEMAVQELIRIFRHVCCRYDMHCWLKASLS